MRNKCLWNRIGLGLASGLIYLSGFIGCGVQDENSSEKNKLLDIRVENPYVINNFETNNDVDYLVLTDSEFIESKYLVDFLDYRNNGQNVGVVDVSEKSPEEIDNFIEYAYKNWEASNSKTGKLEKVLLVGNVENVSSKPFVNDWDDKGFDETEYSDVDGDGRDDLAVGRFNIDNYVELNNITEKIYDYESNLESNLRHPFVLASGYDGGSGNSNLVNSTFYPSLESIEENHDWESFGFDELQEKVADELLKGENIVEIYDSENDYPEGGRFVERDFINQINDGAYVFDFNGHGDVDMYQTSTDAFDFDSIKKLKNSGSYPIFISHACDTVSLEPGVRNLGTELVNASGKGAIAYIGSNTLTSDSPYFVRGFYRTLLENDEVTLGEAYLTGIQDIYDMNIFLNENGFFYSGEDSIVDEMVLLGDPALKVKN